MLSVIIPTYNKQARLRICLNKIIEISDLVDFKFEVIVVNDASTDSTCDMLTELKNENSLFALEVIHLSEQQGRSVSRNIGAYVANGDVLLFIDDDIIISLETLCYHYYQLCRGDVLVLQRAPVRHVPWLFPVDDPFNIKKEDLPPELFIRLEALIKQNWSGVLLKGMCRRSRFEADVARLLNRYKQKNRWMAATGGNISIDKNFFFHLDGFDPNLGLKWGLEDIEFGYRVEKENGFIQNIEHVEVFHLDHPIKNRKAEHKVALDYFTEKHGHIGDRLTSYFEGSMDILEVFADEGQ